MGSTPRWNTNKDSDVTPLPLSCPICRSDDIENVSHYEESVTSDSIPMQAGVDNRICRRCGFVFNVSGVRGNEEDFYTSTYNLLADEIDAEFEYETAAGRQGINAEMVQFIQEQLDLPRRGRLLEIGSGKGIFLSTFLNKFADWEVSVVEPSAKAKRFLRTKLPNVLVHDSYEAAVEKESGTFDLVVAIGVLEHVPEPVSFLEQITSRLTPNGYAFIGVPNFSHNPCDLVTFDHLSRFTEVSLANALQRAGLHVIRVSAGNRLPMWAVARIGAANAPSRAAQDDVPLARRHALSAVRWIEATMEIFDDLGRQIDGGVRRLGVYGTGTLAIAATSLTFFSAEKITCFFDDNSRLVGGQRIGRPIHALSEWREMAITDVTFSANPCYLPVMTAKVRRAMGGDVRIWELPPQDVGDP